MTVNLDVTGKRYVSLAALGADFVSRELGDDKKVYPKYQNQVFDRYDLVHVHSRIVGTLKPDEIAVLKFWHFDRMHRMDAVDHHRAHRMCQALGGKQSVQHVSSYPFGSTEYYVVEKLAAEYEKRFSSDGLREAFLEAVNIMQFVTQRAPGTPTATWFSQLLRGGSGGGWATSR